MLAENRRRRADAHGRACIGHCKNIHGATRGIVGQDRQKYSAIPVGAAVDAAAARGIEPHRRHRAAKLDGYEVARQVRAACDRTSPPLVAMTG